MPVSKVQIVGVYTGRLFLPGGDIWSWRTRVERATTANIKDEAPVNIRINKSRGAPPVGALVRSISSQAFAVGTDQFEINVLTKVPYALYVIKGTGVIVSPTGQGMAIPLNYPLFGRRPGKRDLERGATLHNRVRGQEANNFMLRGMQRTAIRFPSINPTAAPGQSFGPRQLPNFGF